MAYAVKRKHLIFGCFGSDVVNGSAAWGMPVKVKLDAALIAY
jgi:hypothetical protein